MEFLQGGCYGVRNIIFPFVLLVHLLYSTTKKGPLRLASGSA